MMMMNTSDEFHRSTRLYPPFLAWFLLGVQSLHPLTSFSLHYISLTWNDEHFPFRWSLYRLHPQLSARCHQRNVVNSHNKKMITIKSLRYHNRCHCYLSLYTDVVRRHRALSLVISFMRSLRHLHLHLSSSTTSSWVRWIISNHRGDWLNQRSRLGTW